MSKNTSISLGEYLTSFVEAQVGQGRYSSSSRCRPGGAATARGTGMKLQALRAALIEGEQSGPSTPFD